MLQTGCLVCASRGAAVVDLILPGLPVDWEMASGRVLDLAAVPPMPKSDLDPDIPLLQERWLEWAEQVLRYRLGVWERCTQKIAGIDRGATT